MSALAPDGHRGASARRGDSRLGVLAFLGGTALVLAALVIFARYPSLFQRGTVYRTVFNSVSGISLGDEVRYGGLLVGSITKLQLDSADPTQILVTFTVRRGTPIRVDTRATITQVGLLGQPYLNLAPGRRDAPPLPPGGVVPSEANFTFQDAMARLAVFLDRADTLLYGGQRLVSNLPWERLDRTLTHFDTLAGVATRGSTRLFAQLDSATRQFATVLARTERVVGMIDTTVQGAGPELASSQRQLAATLADMRAMVRELRGATGGGDRIDLIVRNLGVASANLARLTDRLERDPSALLKQRQPPAKPVGPPPRE